MTKSIFLTLVSFSIALSGCQKAKMTGVTSAAPTAKTYTPPPSQPVRPVQPPPGNYPSAPPGGGPVMPVDTTVRTPAPEPRDPPPVVVVNAPPPVQTPPPTVVPPQPVTPTSPTNPPPTTVNNPPPTWTPSNPPPVAQTPPETPRPRTPSPEPLDPPTHSNPPPPPTPVTPVTPVTPSNPPTTNNPPPPSTPVTPVTPVNPNPPLNPPPTEVSLPPNAPAPTPRPLDVVPPTSTPPTQITVTPATTTGSAVTTFAQTPNVAPANTWRPPTVIGKSTSPAPTPAGYSPNQPAAPAQPAVDPCAKPGSCGPIVSVEGQCAEMPLMVASEKKQLDILFVVDTSASLVKGPQGSRKGGELQALARQMEAFVVQLDKDNRDTDIHIGVLLGHGPSSKYFGKLFSMGSNDPAVLVLDSKRNRQAVWKALERKMQNVPNDESDAQGEALMMSLHAALSSKANRDEMVSQGLLRAKTNLAVIGVTDEQDVCWNYPDYPGKTYPVDGPVATDEQAFAQGLVPVLKPMGYDKKGRKTGLAADIHETRFFKDVCSTYIHQRDSLGHINPRPLAASDVSDALRALENKPFEIKALMNLIAYPSNATLKAEASNEDENEMAHGLIDVVKALNTGSIADLSEVNRKDPNIDFTKQLSLLGESVRQNAKMTSSLDCHKGRHNPNAINLKSVSIDIMEGTHPLAHCLSGIPCEKGLGVLNANAITPSKNGSPYLSVVPEDPAAFKKALEATGATKLTYQIHYETQENYNTDTGKPVPMNPKFVTSAQGPLAATDAASARAAKAAAATKPSTTSTAKAQVKPTTTNKSTSNNHPAPQSQPVL